MLAELAEVAELAELAELTELAELAELAEVAELAAVVLTHLTRLGVPGLSQVNPRSVPGWSKNGPFRFTLNQIAQILDQKLSQSGSKIE